nr:MAG TPA: hypothetical protein [Caudoviricetes sp.]
MEQICLDLFCVLCYNNYRKLREKLKTERNFI